MMGKLNNPVILLQELMLDGLHTLISWEFSTLSWLAYEWQLKGLKTLRDL